MKLFLFPALLLPLLLLLSAVKKEEPVKWAVQKSSTVTVQGKTNINKFSCGLTRYDACDTLTLVACPAQQSLRLNGTIYLDVFRFDCLNKMMTEELRKTMKAGAYPKLKISFVSLGRLAFEKNQRTKTCGLVDIEIAGVRKRFSINYCYATGNDVQKIELVGCKTICFSDFNLTPPKKLNGLVQAKDELDIQFNLVMRRI